MSKKRSLKFGIQENSFGKLMSNREEHKQSGGKELKFGSGVTFFGASFPIEPA